MSRCTGTSVLCGLAASLAVAQHAPVGSFTGADAFGSGATIPVAWRDVDDDGDPDLAVGNYFGQLNELYVNEGDGSFTRQTPFGAGLTFAVAWADCDHDGDADLAVGNDGQNWLYLNEGGGVFTQQEAFGAGTTVAVAWGDANGDGHLDLAAGNGILGVAQQNRLYLGNGDGTFTGVDAFGVGQTDSVAWADHDDDGDLDLAVGNGGFLGAGQNRLFVNDGAGTFTGQDAFGLGDTAVVAWADANNDGRLDLAVGNWNAGQSYLYVNNGDGTFDETPAFGARDTNTLAWADADLDGDLDVAVGNGDFTSAEQNELYVNEGAGTFAVEPTFGLGSTDGVAWADHDGDGDLDLAVGNEHSPPQNQLWTNNGAPGGWLRVRLEGLVHEHGAGYSNRDAVGAKVTAYAAGHLGDPAHRLGVRQIEAQGGFSSQNDIAQTFGVVGTDAVDLAVRWPGSGGCSIEQAVFGLAIGQSVRVRERLTGDLDGDGVVAFADLLLILSAWGPCPPEDPCPADLDGDGAVTFTDLLLVLGGWGGPCA